MSILNEIFAHKRTELTLAKSKRSITDLEALAAESPLPANLYDRLAAPVPAGLPHLIAEVKHRSPSKGVLSQDFDPLRIATAYRDHGATAVSVLTDERFFGGHLDFLTAINSLMPEIPLLRKDFIFDRYQLLEARAAGASAALLITAMLTDLDLADLIKSCQLLKLTPLVEVHTPAELERAQRAGAQVIGINNRDLHTFKVDLNTTLNLLPQRSAGMLMVAESGIKSPADAARLGRAGADAMLIGESLVTAADIGAAVRSLTTQEPAAR
jgi:indole-3-glycerol phosphate synthase